MNMISRGVLLAILVAGMSGCVNPDERDVRAGRPDVPDRVSTTRAYSCGQSPTSITYWASAWQRDIFDADGVIGGCDFDQSCLPSCWGATSDWTSWAGPLIDCPCH